MTPEEEKLTADLEAAHKVIGTLGQLVDAQHAELLVLRPVYARLKPDAQVEGAPPAQDRALSMPWRAVRTITYAGKTQEDVQRQIDMSLPEGFFCPGGVEFVISLTQPPLVPVEVSPPGVDARPDSLRAHPDVEADYYVHRNSGQAVFVKYGPFFEAQGGLTSPWGRVWSRIRAVSVEDARAKAEALLPRWDAATHGQDGIGHASLPYLDRRA